jgi:hypothetical protein
MPALAKADLPKGVKGFAPSGRPGTFGLKGTFSTPAELKQAAARLGAAARLCQLGAGRCLAGECCPRCCPRCAASPPEKTKGRVCGPLVSGAYRDRTGDLRLAKLCLASRAHPVGAGIADESRDSVRSLAGIAGRYRVLPATACGMYAG